MNGITEHTATDIYEYIKKHEERAFVLKFSAIEIYNEAVKDLLDMESAPLRLLDDPERGTIVEKLTEKTLRDWNHLKQLLSLCEAQRQIGETLLNETSSRSHQILRLTIESSACEFLGKDNSSTLVATVNFVDLAGSERASLALSSGTRLKEGCHINRSLLTLGTVIRKLSKGRNGHIPYRDSKLTRILQPSLGGNARTAIICTICPARSHIEQSRNTLLFASCAKEVATCARVNVVMSDKALVKHLQNELARLECDSRYPGTAPTDSQLEALLREKDAQIKKMTKQMRELKRERDLAQSRLEDLLQLAGDDYTSTQWEEGSQLSVCNVPAVCKEILSARGSNISRVGLDFESTKLCTSLGRNDQMDNYIQHPDKSSRHDFPSPTESISSSTSHGLVSYQGVEEVAEDTNDVKDICMEIQCIEVDEPIIDEGPNFFVTAGSEKLLDLNENHTTHGEHELKTKGQIEIEPPSSNPAFMTLEQQLKTIRQTLDTLGKQFPNESGPWSKDLKLSRSRSCTVMNDSSSWFDEGAQNDATPPCSTLRKFPGRPEISKRMLFPMTDVETETFSMDVSFVSEQSESDSLYKADNAKPGLKGDVTRISNLVEEVKEVAQDQYQKQITDGQKLDHKAKDVGSNPIVGPPTESPSNWPLEFEKKQLKIIELWHDCNVSLVHRSYFFLLFKGDPADSIYVEVELRRLFFLKRTFFHGSLGKSVAPGENASLMASFKSIRRERGMLCRQMEKRMSPEEREILYRKWGIKLDSKERKYQLSCLLWTKIRDMEHIRESAMVVAKLVVEPDQTLKEMFGLSFTPQKSTQRSSSWKRGMSFVK